MRAMILETLGHATLALSREGEDPILLTDPWLTGSCYWRSWWIENYPSPAEIATLKRARYVYLTHEHPDHLHPPSLRLLGPDGPEILVPDFLEMGMDAFLKGEGFRVRRLPSAEWVSLDHDVSAMSLPIWNNDSILILSTPDALIFDLNDAKPDGRVFTKLKRLRDAAPERRCVVLRSHSPASPANSFFVDGGRLERTSKAQFVRAARAACRRIGATDFMPFASQSTFRRSDTEWANAYKVGLADLREHWKDRSAKLHPPYTRLDLATGEASSRDPAAYDPHDTAETRGLIAEQERENAAVTLDQSDLDRLEAQLRELRLYLLALFPRGFGVTAGDLALHFDPRKGRLERRASTGHFQLEIPPLALKEALAFGHVGDLCIPMFTRAHLDGRTTPRRVELFFMLLALRDYGYVGGLGRLARWAAWVGREQLRRLPAPPRPAA
ncbi:MBL fold metallo-hydrolase [Hansschlegelia quercus]|uniref:MBL fold metallo-hydrolase n=2 Tax=Hansschlegelia quercus TaxID=2528245 RepID=A0A4V2JE80_9HYPH|nr:MBL fold metallo-hydrolase [Hansschlegelia quercus]